MHLATTQLIGLDFGSTTSSAVVASAALVRNVLTGRSETGPLCETFRSELVETPTHDDALDLPRLQRLLDGWLDAGNVRPDELLCGGALLTGLAAQRHNAPLLIDLIGSRLRGALIAVADDPRLESWLAFMGACSRLSREHPETPILNLDIGGGTTNLALGLNGQVRQTGAVFVGARHVQVAPGSYRIVRLSRYARAIFDQLGIAAGPGEELSPSAVVAIVEFYGSILMAAVAGHDGENAAARLHQQAAFHAPESAKFVVTASGGVGELVYQAVSGGPRPATTCFGDLGVDLADWLVGRSPWRDDFQKYRPAERGRATVYGLLRHSTQVSGSTIFLPRPEILPLGQLPILGSISGATTTAELAGMISLAAHAPRGSCLHAVIAGQDLREIRELGGRLAGIFRDVGFPPQVPLVILLSHNLGKVLGQYATEWGTLPMNLVVIDEIDIRDAQFAHLGAVRHQVAPLTFYGMH